MDSKQIEVELRAIRRALEKITLSTAARAAYSAEEAARLLGVSSKTVRRMIRRGDILTAPIGSRVLIPVSEVERMATPRQIPRRQRVVTRGTKHSGASVAREARAMRLSKR